MRNRLRQALGEDDCESAPSTPENELEKAMAAMRLDPEEKAPSDSSFAAIWDVKMRWLYRLSEK